MKVFLTLIVILAVIASAIPASAKRLSVAPTFSIAELGAIGGTISRGNSINNSGWVSGYSFVNGNTRRHASLWINGAAPIDLGHLAGPAGYSSVVWPVKNNSGLVAGITQTAIDDPNDENWSCSP